jgi:hypothetical protein
MNRKKALTLLITAAFLLCICTAAYAYTVSGNSSISTGVIKVTGTSTTWCNYGAPDDFVLVTCSLYKDGAWCGSNTTHDWGSSVSISTSGANSYGLQTWDVYGYHEASDGYTTKSCNTHYSTNY